VRKPDENAEQVYRYLLEHNARMYAVSWSIDDSGDIYLTGRLPLSAVSAEEIDRVLGAVLEYADGSFNTLLQLGFGSSIRREWAWRVKNKRVARQPGRLRRVRPARTVVSKRLRSGTPACSTGIPIRSRSEIGSRTWTRRRFTSAGGGS